MPLKMRHRASVIAAVVIIGTLAEAIVSPKPLLIWNVTASAPLGLYRRSNGPVSPQDWVLIYAPDAARTLAAVRHYIPRNVPMVKRIAGLPGDTICRAGGLVRVNGTIRAVALNHDHLGRSLPHWSGCQRLRGDQVFVLTKPAMSFDGRYFGPTAKANLIERIEPVWTY